MSVEFEVVKLGDKIPNVPCVYFLMNDIELCYVGRTVDLKKRMIVHKKKLVDEIYDSIYYIPVEDYDKLKELEKKYILDFEPKWNYQTESFSKPVQNPWKPCNCR